MTPRARALLLNVLFVVSHIGTAAIAREAALTDSGISSWWIPSGILLCYLYFTGLPGLAFAFVTRCATIALLFGGFFDPWWLGLLQSAAVVVVYGGAAAALRTAGLSHARLRELGWFVVIAVVAAPLLASLATAALRWAATDVATPWLDIRAFFVGDAIGVAAVFPMAVLIANYVGGLVRPPALPTSLRRRLVLGGQVLAVGIVPAILFGVSDPDTVSPALVAAVLPILWVATREGLVITAIGLFVLESSISAAAVWRLGPSAELIELQTVMLVSALGAMFAAGATRSAATKEAMLIQDRAKWAGLVNATTDLVQQFASDGSLNEEEGRLTADSFVMTSHLAEGIVQRWRQLGPNLSGRPYEYEWQLSALDGVRPLRTRLIPQSTARGEADGFLAITEQLDRGAARIEPRRTFDRLTGLPGRSAIEDELDVRMRELAGADGAVGVCVIELDRIQLEYDGTAAQRELVLSTVASRLHHHMGAGDLLARSGGDQFQIVTQAQSIEVMAESMERVRTAVTAPYPIDRSSVQLEIRMGLAATDRTKVRSSTLLARAEVAASIAAESRADRVIVLDERDSAAETERTRLRNDLQRIGIDSELVLHYQPIVSSSTATVIGHEALVRWKHQDFGLLLPDRFLPVVQATGQSAWLGRLVVQLAAEQIMDWQRLGQSPGIGRVSVNVTASHLPSLMDDLLDARDRLGVDLSKMAIEVTETELVDDLEVAVPVLAWCRKQGMTVSIDDFGQGFSSLGSLRRLPVDTVKIDREFIEHLTDRREDIAVVRMVAGLASELDLTVIAEGVETSEQAHQLSELGVDWCQGYLFGRPRSPADMGEAAGPGPASSEPSN